MSLASDPKTLLAALTKADKDADAARLVDILKAFDAAQVTVATLQDLKIGAAVAKFRKHADAAVADAAKALVRKWKEMASAAGVTKAAPSSSADKETSARAAKPPADEDKKSRAATTTAKITKTTKELDEPGVVPRAGGGIGVVAKKERDDDEARKRPPTEAAANSKRSHGTTPSRTTTTTTSVPSQQKKDDETLAAASFATTLPEPRAKSRLLLLSVLRGDGPATPGWHGVAEAVEAAIAAAYPNQAIDPTEKAAYKTKLRQLHFNLKKNAALREALLDGDVSSTRLVSMTAEELATQELQAERRRMREFQQDARSLDWDKRNRDRINKAIGIDESKGMFQCKRCKSKRISNHEKQTRSADEPMTQFFECADCGNRWRF